MLVLMLLKQEIIVKYFEYYGFKLYKKEGVNKQS